MEPSPWSASYQQQASGTGLFSVLSLATSAMQPQALCMEVFVNKETIPYVIEADGTLDVAALQLQPATVVINGSVITPTLSCRQKLTHSY